ncbi:MAG: response regulator [Ktedonobacteraceae bacterium]
MHMQQCSQGNVAAQTKTILIVEDDVAVGTFLVTAITQETLHHAYVVNTGVQALRACATDAIDLIVLDYSLPLMNGIELYDKLCTLQGYRVPPVVMVSAHLPVSELAKRHLPSLRKPLELQNLLDTIERLLQ